MAGMSMMGGMGGMGGGFRSVPPTDLPNASLAPGQTRDLATRIVSLNAPGPDGLVALPAKGERLELGDISQLETSTKVQEVMRRLARDKAPETVAQLALWGAAGMPWDEVARLSHGWANAHELALAKQLASSDTKSAADTGRLLVEVSAREESQRGLAAELAKALAGRTMLGLAIEPTVPARPSGPAVACKVQLIGTREKPEATVQVAFSDASGTAWTAAGKFPMTLAVDEKGVAKGDAFGDTLAEDLAKRLVGVKLAKTPSSGPLPKGPKDKDAYTIRVENYSPLLLNGVAVVGEGAKETEPAKVLLGISLSPRRSLSLPATAAAVERLGLKQGIKVLALDLSGL
jgi:hypothetical protein